MKRIALFLSAAALLAGCADRVRYHDMPPVTNEKKPVTDVAPPDTSGRMKTRSLYLKKRVAIARFGDVRWVEDLPFERDEELVQQSGGPERLTEMLISELHKSGRFDIVERKNIEGVLNEIKFGESKWVDKTSAARAGTVLGAQCILFASVGRNVDAANRPTGGILAYLRMVDVSTSRVTAAALGAGPDLQTAIARSVAAAVKASERAPWVGKIAKVNAGDGNEVVIDSGKDLGLEPGDTFAVFSLGDAVKDPDSGKILGYLEEGAGVIRIVKVQEHISVAEPVTLTREVRIGDLVRPALQY